MPIYTGTGDKGYTGLFDNQRVPKDDLRIRAYGTVDEVNSTVGLLRCESLPPELDKRLEQIQSALFELGANLAMPGKDRESSALSASSDLLERWIDESEKSLPQLTTFVLPGGHREAALLHVARTITRRAERRFWALHRQEKLPDDAGIYLNRLSDLFFSWARAANLRNGVEDVPWVSQAGTDR